MQINNYKQSNYIVDPPVPLHFPAFLFLLSPNPRYAKVLQERTKCEIV